MKEQFQQIVDLMRKHVLKNLELIKANESHIREVLNWTSSVEKNKELNDSYKYSKILLTENNDYINLQVSIMNFVNKYQNKFEAQPVMEVNQSSKSTGHGKNLSREDLLKLTIQSDLTFDPTHPYFHDDDFFNDLLNYYKQNENYEMCAELLRIKK